MQVAKTGKNQDAWTVKVDRQKAIRVRLTESGFAAVLRVKDDGGKWRDRYLCYLSKGEWNAARRKSLGMFAELLAGKVEGRIATGEGDADKLGALVGMLRTIS